MLSVGKNKIPILEYVETTRRSFLLLDDGRLIDRLTLPDRRKVTRFDYTTDSFNPLTNVEAFVDVLNGLQPQGEHTLTRGQSDLFLLETLPCLKRLADFPEPNTKDNGQMEAARKIKMLLLSPVLKEVLQPGFFPQTGTIIARLNRTELGDRTCFALGNLLMARYKRHIVVSDYGFYALPSHVSLIHEGRLTAGLNFLDEVSAKIRNSLLLIDDKHGSQCTYEDAKVLANACGLIPDLSREDSDYNKFIREAMA